MDEAQYMKMKKYFGELRKDPPKHKELLEYIAKHPEYLIRRLKLEE